MKRSLLQLLLTLIFAVTVSHAADFWNKKQPEQWNNDEVQTLLSKSPWAKEAKVTRTGGGGQNPQGPSGGGGGGYPGGGGGYPGGGGGRRTGIPGMGRVGVGLPGGGGVGRMPGGRTGGGRGPSAERAALPKITVRWQSALPVRQATEKWAADDVCATHSAADANYYAVCMVGLPALADRRNRSGQEAGDDTDNSANTRQGQSADERLRQALVNQTSLHGKDQSSVYPHNVEIVHRGNVRAVLFLFARDGRIEDNKEVQFESHVRNFAIQATFKPKEMKYRGKLAL